MDSRSRGLTARAENDNRRVACHPWGRVFSGTLSKVRRSYPFDFAQGERRIKILRRIEGPEDPSINNFQ